ncbi:MAG: T9SS type A sorting domain-containing protein, partial [Bacteroidota bacterium]
ALEDDTYYIVVVQFDAPDQDTNLFLVGSDALDYGAMSFASAQSDGPTQYGSMLDVGNSGDFSIVGFGFDLVPIMQLHIGESADLINSAIEFLSADNKVSIAPNPATQTARLDIGLVNTQEVDVQVFNTMGQRVFAQQLGKLQQGNLELQVSDLPAGTYLVRINAEEGVRTLKLSVTK